MVELKLILSCSKKGEVMRQILLYGCVGSTAALVDFGVFFVCLQWMSLDYKIASVIAFIAAVTVNFLLCNAFVFTRTGISFLSAYARHVSTNIISFLMGLGMLMGLVNWGGIHSLLLPKITIAGLLMFFNYACARWFSFNNHW
jgi:putative flippase GtrA